MRSAIFRWSGQGQAGEDEDKDTDVRALMVALRLVYSDVWVLTRWHLARIDKLGTSVLQGGPRNLFSDIQAKYMVQEDCHVMLLEV